MRIFCVCLILLVASMTLVGCQGGSEVSLHWSIKNFQSAPVDNREKEWNELSDSLIKEFEVKNFTRAEVKSLVGSSSEEDLAYCKDLVLSLTGGESTNKFLAYKIKKRPNGHIIIGVIDLHMSNVIRFHNIDVEK